MVESSFVTATIRTEPKPPIGIIESLGTGFEVVIARLGLILIPLLLDGFLWMGPKISFYPLVERFATVASALPQATEGQAQTEAMVKFFTFLSDRLNVFSLVNTAPIGVPSLMVEKQLDDFSQSESSLVFTNSDWRIVTRSDTGQLVPLDWQAFTALVAFVLMLFNLLAFTLPGFDLNRLSVNPSLGNGFTLPLTNELLFVLLTIALPLVGLLLTAVYYSQIALALREPKATLGDFFKRSSINWAKLTAFNLLFRFFAICIGLPFVLVTALIQVMSVELGGLIAALGMTTGMWFMVYISFTMQSIALQDRGVFGAVWDSMRLVHISLFPVIGLVLLSLVLNWGMNYLFALPEANSWWLALGILGHAFVSTSLVAATFVFYKDRHRWWLEMRQWVKTQKPTAR
jgi:hypothetical protein